MKNSNSFSVIFFLRRKSAKSKKFPIYTRITLQGQSIEFVTKLEIDETKWDKARGLPISKTEDGKKITHMIESIKGKILTDYNACLFNNEFVNPEILKNRFFGTIDENKRMTLLELFDFHNEEMKNMLVWGTLKNYFTTRKYFEMYLKDVIKRKDIELHELNYRFLSGFELYMRKELTSIDHDRPCSNNTIMKHIERFRKVINLAIKNEWLDKDPFVKFKPKFIHKDREFLSPQELQKIEKKKFPILRLQQVKDLFVFSCYTGLAYIDSYNLEPNNVNFGINGKLWITTSRQKTNQSVRIPLLPKAQEIIVKYQNDPTLLKQNKLLPQFSNQKLNSYLKEIADCCGITKTLTFHMARHTFATTVTLSNGVPLETVSKLLGHTTIRMTQVYAKVVETKVMDDMDKLTDRLEGNFRKLSKAH